jgi:hypothetical protein
MVARSVTRSVLIAGAVGLLAAPLLASPALAGTARADHAQPPDYPPKAQRIAATTATFDAIEARIAAWPPRRAAPPRTGCGSPRAAM